MAKLDQIEALIRAHCDGNNDFFRRIVLQISAHAMTKSPDFAHRLKQMADRAPTGQFIALPQEMDKQLQASTSNTKLSDMVLGTSLQPKIDRILHEHRERDRLFMHGLSPIRKLLFVGPPGVGKTMLASALAHELGIPILKVQLHTVIESHLGETAKHLGKIFQTIRAVRGVYLFDEFDALARGRSGATHDVTEMSRVVNSLLGFLEQDDSDSLIIGATNLGGSVDKAMFRRFDDVIDFPLPTRVVAEQLIRARLDLGGTADLLWTIGIDWEAVTSAADGIGHHDLVSASRRVCKDALLAGRDRIETAELVKAIKSRAPSYDGLPS